MQLASLLASALTIAAAVAQGSHTEWKPPGHDDFRGPCPMMNTLANHAFLPHDGRNITKANAVHALSSALNFNESLAAFMWEQAVFINPEPNATYFTLDMLNKHNVLEHDASLSRADAYFGNNHRFNKTVFDWTKQFWTAPTLTAQMLANSKLARQVFSRAFNPTYSFTESNEQFSVGEVSAPIVAYGDLHAFTVDRDFVEYWIENERFPTELGWKVRDEVVGIMDILRLSKAITDAGNLITGEKAGNGSSKSAAMAVMQRRDLHSGFGAGF
ncbi:uncharacterized protein K452DRAFT_353555 [Aplosporella prunicola CBS 121167]|uniref:Heme haloperoxidase family profile domain-containing protein n=1 Tax=Aplosporella prunicola CBS 121167 TaxID=1176127 RepID=A0A6A6B2F0_9PEZI|nr:uncharacterized protein K452DRAFT_353555 [Aplosporella prunicola CBS 121167]KAF2137435.1 hypothetical protein K452DRAFT_353555 [Aplosporella prunicola CBS 121167]